MSLVNDMLRDLDNRDNAESEMDDVRPVPRVGRRVWQVWAMTVAGVSLVAASAFGYRLVASPADETPRPRPSPAAAVVSVLEGAAPETSGPEVAAAEPTGQATAEPVDDHSGASESALLTVASAETTGTGTAAAREHAVNALLAAAGRALADDRLTQPPANNAYALYQHVLLLDPQNAAAKAGVAKVQARYRILVRDAIAKDDWAAAEGYLQRARVAGTSPEQLAPLQNALAESQQRENRHVSPEPLTAQVPKMDAAGRSTQSVAPARAEQANSEAQPASREGETSIQQSWRSLEADALERAEQRAARGDASGAIAALQTVYGQHRQAERAAARLFELYLQTGRMDEARALIARRGEDPLQRYFQAKLLTRDGNDAAALKLLRQGRPSEALTQPYLALQAALFQRLGEPVQAARLYQHLVELDRYQTHYWLGLAIASEAAGQPMQALRAFVAADQLAPVNPAVSHYIKQRIQALSSSGERNRVSDRES